MLLSDLEKAKEDTPSISDYVLSELIFLVDVLKMLLEPQFLSIVPDICYTWCFYINYTSYQISSKKFNFQYHFRTYEVTPLNSDYGLSETRLQAPTFFFTNLLGGR